MHFVKALNESVTLSNLDSLFEAHNHLLLVWGDFHTGAS